MYQLWRSANGWYAYVVNGVLVAKVRYPAPGSKRWLAMLRYSKPFGAFLFFFHL